MKQSCYMLTQRTMKMGVDVGTVDVGIVDVGTDL